MEIIKNKLNEAKNNFETLAKDEALISQIKTTTDWLISAIKSGNKLLVCGNGGSAADAQHLAGEFLCRFYKDRPPLPAIALTTDSSTITAIANDYDYDQVFSRQLEGIGKANDILIGISTSGSSKNVLEAFKKARKMNIKTVLLTGKEKKSISEFSDLILAIPSTDTPRVQEMHLLVEHIIAEIVEEYFSGSK